MRSKNRNQTYSAPQKSDNDRIVFGIHAVEATLRYMPKRAVKLSLLQKNARLDVLERLAKQAHIPVVYPTKDDIGTLIGGELVHQGAILHCNSYPYVDLAEVLEDPPDLCVVLDGVEDPRNLGRAARSAFAFGAKLLVVAKDRAAPVTGVAEKAAVGALARIQVAQVTNLKRALDDLKKAGLWVTGTASEAKVPAWKCDFKKPTALVIGSEEKGMSRLVQESCDELVSLPMAASDMSLNAADAATVVLYEVNRQRRN